MAGGQIGTTVVFTTANELIVAASSTAASGTLAAGYLQPIDATGGAASWTLPAASSVAVGGPMVAVKKIDTGANTVTIARAGSDVILGTGTGVTSRVLTLAGETVYLQSNGIGIWTVVANDITSGLVATVAQNNAYGAAIDYLTSGSPAFERANMERLQAGADSAILSTGVMLSVALPLYAGDVVTNLTWLSGATPANTPTHWWFALYSNAATPALLAQTADQTSTAWAAGTVKTLALTAPQTITTTGVYYAAIMMAATTPISLIGRTMSGTVGTGGWFAADKILVQNSGSTLTTTAPATITGATTLSFMPRAVAT